VGSFPAGDTRTGIHDMSGNVGEWTASAYCKYPSHSCSNPNRVFRGGSWLHSSASTFRGTARMSGAPDNRYTDIGFRCAKDKD
jgi:iron(II)-dependent oxidoreductase